MDYRGTQLSQQAIGTLGPVGSVTVTSGAYTLLISDHLKTIVVDSATAVVLTVPSTLPDGFSFQVIQVNTGTISFSAGGRNELSNAARQGTGFPYDSASCTVCRGNASLLVVFNNSFPTLLTQSTAAVTRTTATQTAIPGLSFDLLAGAVYAFDFRTNFTASTTTTRMTMGMSALPSGSRVQGEGRIENTPVVGTSNTVCTPLLTPSAIAASNSSSVVGSTHIGIMSGRIYVGGTGGTLTCSCATIAATGTLTVASGDASCELRQVY